MYGNLCLTKWYHFLKSMILPIIKLHRYGPKQMGKLSKLITLFRKLYNLLLTKGVIGNMNWTHSCWTTEILLIAQQVKLCPFLLFSRVVRDKLSTVPSTVDSSRHDDAIKLNRAQKQKMKTSLSMRNEEQN